MLYLEGSPTLNIRMVWKLTFSFTIDGDCYEKRDYKEIVLRIKRRLP